MVKQITPYINKYPCDVIDDNPLVLENKYDIEKLKNKSWSSITVKEDSLQRMKGKLILSGFPHVQFIHFLSGSFNNVSSLTISNLPELAFIIVDCDALHNTKSLTLSSILHSMIC